MVVKTPLDDRLAILLETPRLTPRHGRIDVQQQGNQSHQHNLSEPRATIVDALRALLTRSL